MGSRELLRRLLRTPKRNCWLCPRQGSVCWVRLPEALPRARVDAQKTLLWSARAPRARRYMRRTGGGRRRGGGGGGGRRRGSREQRRRARGCRGRQAEKDEFHERQWLGRPQVGSSLLSCRAHPLPLRSGRLSDSSPAFFSMSSPVTRRLAISSPHWSLRAPRQNQPPAARGEACATSALPGNARLLADAENASDQTRRPRSGPEPPRPRC